MHHLVFTDEEMLKRLKAGGYHAFMALEHFKKLIRTSSCSTLKRHAQRPATVQRPRALQHRVGETLQLFDRVVTDRRHEHALQPPVAGSARRSLKALEPVNTGIKRNLWGQETTFGR
jgi:hypothetical protein